MLKTDGSGKSPADRDGALAVGIKALEYIAGDPVQLHRFLDLSGLGVGQLRAAASKPAFFAGLLDFMLGHEATLLAFASEAGIAPEAVRAARERLGDDFGSAPR